MEQYNNGLLILVAYKVFPCNATVEYIFHITIVNRIKSYSNES